MPCERADCAEAIAGPIKTIMLIGSLVGVLSVFLWWFNLDYSLAQFNNAGLDFLLDSSGYPESYPKIGYYAYMPLVVLIASAAAAVVSVILNFANYERKAAASGAALGAVVLVSALLYVFYPMSKIAVSASNAVLIADLKLSDHLDAGAYFAMIAGTVLILGGTLILLLQRKGNSGAERAE